MSRRVTPRCCDDGRRFIKLRFGEHIYDHLGRAAYMKAVRTQPPQWILVARPNHPLDYEVAVHVLYCPFCGHVMPAVQLRKNPPKRICITVDGGYYCETCERRLNECQCPTPERLWEPVRKR